MKRTPPADPPQRTVRGGPVILLVLALALIAAAGIVGPGLCAAYRQGASGPAAPPGNPPQ